MKVISMSALAPRCGKDELTTLAMQELKDAHHKTSARVAFGNALKMETAKALFPRSDVMQCYVFNLFSSDKDHPITSLSINSLCMSEYKAFLMQSGHDWLIPRSPRWHLQQYGTEYTRVYQDKPDYWIDQVVSKIEELHHVDFVFITDTRFQPEFIMARKDYGAFMVYINPIAFPADHWGPGGIHQHLNNKNETGLADWMFDLQLNNVYEHPNDSMRYLVANILHGY